MLGELKILTVLRGALLGVHLPGIARGSRFARPVLIPSATASQTVARSKNALCPVWCHLARLSEPHPT